MKELISIFVSLFIIISICCLDFREANAELCFDGKPYPDCRNLFLAEISFYRAMNSIDFDRGAGTLFDYTISQLFNLDIGVMRNLDQQNSIGVLIFIGYEFNEQHGLRVRYRRWLWENISVSLSPGLVMPTNLLQSPALSGELNFSFHDFLIFSYRMDKLKTTLGRVSSHTQHYIGVKTNSYVALSSIAKAFKLGDKQTEWVSLQFGYGNYKSLIRTSFFTRRWEHFYWSPICGEFGGELGDFNDYGLIIGGSCAGIPIYLGSTTQHEVQIGAGLTWGYSAFQNDGFNRGTARAGGPALNGNLSYIWHMRERIAWQASVDFVNFIIELSDYDKPPNSRAFFLGIQY